MSEILEKICWLRLLDSSSAWISSSPQMPMRQNTSSADHKLLAIVNVENQKEIKSETTEKTFQRQE